MKKPLAIFVVLAFLVVALVGSVLAADVAYVVRSSADPVLKAEISSAGLTYDVITEANLTSTNFSKYKILLVGNDNFVNFENIPVEKYNSLIMNSYHFYQKGIFQISDSQWGWSSARGSASSPTNVRFNTLNTTLIEGIPESFKAYTVQDIDVNTYYLKGNKATGSKMMVRVDSGISGNAVIALAYPGTKYLNGKTGNARSLFFGIVEPKYWTIQSRQLFRNSLDWVLIGEDNDSDGFYTDNDCDDANAAVNPSELDLEYDGIDQDCDGADLADVDFDAYCLAGYVIENTLLQCPNETGALGTDCNDDDLLESPGSSNLSLNCVNDAPIISSIPSFIFRETQIVTLNLNANDPEGDVLSYSINDSKFVQSQTQQSTFTWQTGFYDAGNHSFMAVVSDGQLNSTKNFKVEVKDKNQEPVLNTTIPEQTWSEDTNFSLDLSGYFNDPDPQDNLTFGVSKTSTDQDITVESIVNGIVNFIVKRDWSGFDWIVFFAYDGDDKTESNNVTLTVTPVNDAPILLNQIPSQTWNEDAQTTLNLSKYFADGDSSLIYSLTGNVQVSMVVNGGIATLTPAANWNGVEKVKIDATDGEFNVLSNEITLTVNPVNDVPVLSTIPSTNVLAGSLVDINPTAIDVDGDSLVFTFTAPLDSEGKWQTTSSDFGIKTVTVIVLDGKGGTSSQQFTVNVIQKFYINELVANPTSGNEWIEIYNSYDQVISLVDCVVKDGEDNTFALNGTLGKNQFFVVETNNKLDDSGDMVKLYCSNQLIDSVAYGSFNDGNLTDNAPLPGLGESISRSPDGTDTDVDSLDFKVFKSPTKALASNTDMVAPVVALNTPIEGSLFTDTRDISFEFTVVDNMASSLDCSIYLNGVLKASKAAVNSSAESILVKGIPDGSYSWNVECYDGRNKALGQSSKSLTISAPDNPLLSSIGKKSVNENETLEFTVSATDPDKDSVLFSIQNAPQGVSFIDGLNETAEFSWTPTYEQAGDYNVTFVARDSTGLQSQEIVKISVKDQRIPPKFSDLERCEVKDSKLEISLKDPDDGDEFEVGEKIGVRAEIKNNGTEDLDVDVKVYLYDTDEEQVVEKEKENGVSIDAGKDESVGFDLAIPEDLENNEFAIFVSAEGKDGETLCNEHFVYIDIQRKEHEIVIKDVLMDLESVSPGDTFDLTVEMQNMGSEDEDVHVEIKNSELRLSQKSEEFELERYGDRDEEIRTFTVKIPENAQEGEYDLEIKVASVDAEDSRTQTFYVLRKEGATEGGAVLYQKEGTAETAQQDEQNQASLYLALNLFLLMIIVIAVAVFRFVKIKR